MVSLNLILIGIVPLLVHVGCEKENKYDNYTLVRMFPSDELQVASTVNFKDPLGEVEVLKTSRGLNDSLDVLVPPGRIAFVQDYAQDKDLIFEVKHTYYGRRLDLEQDRVPKRRLMQQFNNFGYHSYSTILEYIDDMALRNPDVIKLQSLGNSYQGRLLKLVKISKNHNAGNPIILLDAGIHAREWVAPAMALYMIQRLTSVDGRRKELEGVDWYIIPVVNPDGYEYTRASKSNRMWRKTRSKSNSDCVGVDGNRNYGFKWAVSGVSKDPCNKETYAGPKPFSEPETRMVRNVMVEYGKRIKLYVSLHAYGQYLVYPWGYTGDYLPKEWQKLDKLAKRVSSAVQKAGGLPFKVLSAGKWYAAAGGSDDYAFGAIGVPYSYTMELTDGYEFVFPEGHLRTVLPQFYEGFKAFGAQIRTEFKPLGQKRVLRHSSSSSSSSSESED